MTIRAEVIADSLNGDARLGRSSRLTTMVWEYPRCIHSEIMTHRALSKCSASSRAIPIEKMIQRVIDDPFIPQWWGKAQPGMQANEEIATADCDFAKKLWLDARDSAVDHARDLNRLGLHKQVVNRLLEPWMHIVIVVSGTDWNNFFALRDHPAAEPHFQLLAKAAKKAMSESTPVMCDGRKSGDRYWHLPFVTEEERGSQDVRLLARVSTARCDRVSYLNHDQTAPSIEADLKLYEKLAGSTPKHASPLEHAAEAMDPVHRIGNFRGWHQHRHMVEGESVRG